MLQKRPLSLNERSTSEFPAQRGGEDARPGWVELSMMQSNDSDEYPTPQVHSPTSGLRGYSTMDYRRGRSFFQESPLNSPRGSGSLRESAPSRRRMDVSRLAVFSEDQDQVPDDIHLSEPQGIDKDSWDEPREKKAPLQAVSPGPAENKHDHRSSADESDDSPVSKTHTEARPVPFPKRDTAASGNSVDDIEDGQTRSADKLDIKSPRKRRGMKVSFHSSGDESDDATSRCKDKGEPKVSRRSRATGCAEDVSRIKEMFDIKSSLRPKPSRT